MGGRAGAPKTEVRERRVVTCESPSEDMLRLETLSSQWHARACRALGTCAAQGQHAAAPHKRPRDTQITQHRLADGIVTRHPSFRQRQRLLLHRLVDCHPFALPDRVKLVDAAQAAIRQHERARLKHPLVAVAHGGGREARGGGAPPRRENCPRGETRCVFQKLALPGARVADDQEVGFPADSRAALGELGDAANEGEGDCGDGRGGAEQ